MIELRYPEIGKITDDNSNRFGGFGSFRAKGGSSGALPAAADGGCSRMSREDKIRFYLLLIVTTIVMTMNIHIVTQLNSKGLHELDSIINGYMASTARNWAQNGGDI